MFAERLETREGKQRGEISPELKLPDDKMFALLASLGNSEAKALTLLVVGEGDIFTEKGLSGAVNDHQTDGKGWKADSSVAFSYCQNSLTGIGHVTEKVDDPNRSASYQITEYGRTTGIALAGLLLKWSFQHPDFSLYKMFGSTSVPNSLNKNENVIRGPITRYKILIELITNPEERIRMIDLILAVGEGDVDENIRSLGKSGVIRTEHAERGKPSAFYKIKETIPDRDPIPLYGSPTISEHVYALLKENTGTFLSAEYIAHELIHQFPKYANTKQINLRDRVAIICKNLISQGFVQRLKFSWDFKSEVTLFIDQKEAIASLIERIDRFQMGEHAIWDEGKEFASKVLAEQDVFSTLMQKAKEASPMANKQKPEQTRADILSIIEGYSDGITLGDLQEAYKKKTGRGIHIITIASYAKNLVGQHLLIKKKTNFGYAYSINKQGP